MTPQPQTRRSPERAPAGPPRRWGATAGSSSSARRGFSLAEMLIVVTIMIMLVAITLPVAKKLMDGSQVREASRQLHAYVAMVKSRALQTGRPCGLYLAFPTPPLGITDPPLAANQLAQYWPVRQVTQVFLAETPAPYSGGTTYAIGKIWDPNGNASGIRVFQPVTFTAANGWIVDVGEVALLQSLIDPGEVFQVRFNYKGEWYHCKRGVASDTIHPDPMIFYFLIPNTNSTIPFGFNDTTSNNNGGRPFQILRSPRPVGNALELPNGACIDITYSGVGSMARQFTIPPGVNSPLTGLTVLLAPGGNIDSLYLDTVAARRLPMAPPTGSLFFLVGKVEKAIDPVSNPTSNPALTDPTIFTNLDQSNLADPNSLWVVLNRGSGQVSTAENTPPPFQKSTLTQSFMTIFPGDPRQQNLNAPAQILSTYVAYCREAALRGEQVGGQ